MSSRLNIEHPQLLISTTFLDVIVNIITYIILKLDKVDQHIPKYGHLTSGMVMDVLHIYERSRTCLLVNLNFHQNPFGGSGDMRIRNNRQTDTQLKLIRRF